MTPETRQRKQIVVGCDGTWLNSDDGYQLSFWEYLPFASQRKGTVATPSNVTRLCRALQPRPPNVADKVGETPSGNYQIVSYQPGLASERNFWDHFVNGATAKSISENIRNAYVAVAENWERGAEIFLLGFSRGSFVARSTASVVAAIGMLNKEGMEQFCAIFEDWEHQNDPSWKNLLFPGESFAVAPGQKYSPYTLRLESAGYTELNVPVKAVACFDTVGSLGIPRIHISNRFFGALLNPIFDFFQRDTRRLAFVNTEVLPNVSNCFHALAIDEIRIPFSPTLWEIPASRDQAENPITLKQCWFPGAHGNVGGSVDDAELPDITLAWMTAQLRALGLDFDEKYLEFCRHLNEKYYVSTNQPQRGWAHGRMDSPYTGIERLGGKKARKPGQYCRTATNTPLRQTNETIHPSVRVRWQTYGKGMGDEGRYYPPALKGYQLYNSDPDADATDPLCRGFWWEVGSGERLCEDPLDDSEVVLLDTYRNRSLASVV